MHEIKFRAWDKQTDELIYNVLVEISEHDDWTEGYSSWSVANDMEIGNDERLVFMQYIGLKDKNGKEIYEGDIIQEQTIMIGHTGKVFQQGSGEWSVSYRRGSHPFYIPDGFENSIETHSLQDWASDKRIVVIGNIYENPELLKSE